MTVFTISGVGAVKNWIMEQQARGWYAARLDYVCAECFNDETIQAFVDEGSVATCCDYCGREEDFAIARDADEVLALIYESISSEWGDALDEGVPWETREGGWQLGPVYDTYDLLDHLGWPVLGESFLDEVLHSLEHHSWCQKHFFSLRREDALGYGWHEFVKKVKYETRYVFLAIEGQDEYMVREEISAAAMLGEIGRAVDDANLNTTLPAGTPICRARLHAPGEAPRTAKELGPPPRERAIVANRMSPAGIPMFYGAADEKTAVTETLEPLLDAESGVTVATFVAARDLRILDMASLPEVPSLFDRERRRTRSSLSFLHDFADDLSRPIARDGREHIEYVPTQVVTEYLRHVYRPEGGDSLDGLAYRSSRLDDSICYVLFLENSDCADDGVNSSAEAPPTLVLHEAHAVEPESL